MMGLKHTKITFSEKKFNSTSINKLCLCHGQDLLPGSLQQRIPRLPKKTSAKNSTSSFEHNKMTRHAFRKTPFEAIYPFGRHSTSNLNQTRPEAQHVCWPPSHRNFFQQGAEQQHGAFTTNVTKTGLRVRNGQSATGHSYKMKANNYQEFGDRMVIESGEECKKPLASSTN